MNTKKERTALRVTKLAELVATRDPSAAVVLIAEISRVAEDSLHTAITYAQMARGAGSFNVPNVWVDPYVTLLREQLTRIWVERSFKDLAVQARVAADDEPGEPMS
jgi:hypothetical protein